MAESASDLPIAHALGLVHAALIDTRRAADQPSRAEVLAALELLRQLRDELTAWEPELITAARDRGASWVELAPVLGVASRQAAERRYLRLRPSASGEATGEGRVRAERGKRAGERAVTLWARANSASLRELAGQVSAAPGVPAAGQDQVRDALADDDPAALLSPLADAQPHLAADHAILAEQIGTVTEHVERLRGAVRDDR
jgi:hypothetical protein